MSVWLPRTSNILHRRCFKHFGYTHFIHSQKLPPYPIYTFRSITSSSPKPPSPQSSSTTQPNAVDSKAASTLASPSDNAPLTQRVWKSVKEGASHYWHGTKLLVSEVRISARLQRKLLHGETLTRRERRQVCYFCFDNSYCYVYDMTL